MFVQAEDGNVYNLHHAYKVTVEPHQDASFSVAAYFFLGEPSGLTVAVLASGRTEPDARRILHRLMRDADSINLNEHPKGRSPAVR